MWQAEFMLLLKLQLITSIWPEWNTPRLRGGKERSLHHETKQVTGPKGEELYSPQGRSGERVNTGGQWSNLPHLTSKEEKIKWEFHSNLSDAQTIFPARFLQARRMDVHLPTELCSSCVLRLLELCFWNRIDQCPSTANDTKKALDH